MSSVAEQIDLQPVGQAVERFGRDPEMLIPILLHLQERYHYLPKPVLERVAELTDSKRSDVISVAHFYQRFRHKPAGEHIIHVCHGTACHVKGADRITEALRDHLDIAEGSDTDPTGRYTLDKVACLGCCTLAPAVQVEESTFGYLTPQGVGPMLEQFEARQKQTQRRKSVTPLSVEEAGGAEVRVGLGSCCVAKGSHDLMAALEQAVWRSGAKAAVRRVGCVGVCHRTPWVEINIPGREPVFYAGVTSEQAQPIIHRHFRTRNVMHRIGALCNAALDTLIGGNGHPSLDQFAVDVRDPALGAFLHPQLRIATEHFGEIDPLDFDQYLELDGFAALRRCLDQLTPEQLIDEIDRSGLRGRGGGGFPTGRKWRFVREQAEPMRYVICNGDEGDPGAFMDRMIMESLPFRLIEGVAIAAYAVGAEQAVVYVRNEYPLAVRRMNAALDAARRHGWLGDNVLGSGFAFDIELREGAGAFVCGEETALIQSLHGKRGNPTLRPPYPAEVGLRGKPTLVNNVETYATVPWIIRRGASAFSAIGTKQSKGAKVFALAGKVKRGGLIEVPMGTTIRQIVEEVGGGVEAGRTFKAVQIGGPSGGCIPASMADIPVDYEALAEAGAMMGSGGLVVLDDRDCIVDIARYFLTFTQNESCAQCKPCFKGTKVMLKILDRICTGQGTAADLEELEQLAHEVRDGSLCGLGRTAPNPILTTLKYFRAEYEAHIAGRCPAGVCRDLITYHITDDCIGCTLCAQHCPVDAIAYAPYRVHTIDQNLCTKCDACRAVCPEDAVAVE